MARQPLLASLLQFRDITQLEKITLGRTPQDVESARRRDLCLTTLKRERHHASGAIRNRSLSKRAAADPRLRMRGTLIIVPKEFRKIKLRQ